MGDVFIANDTAKSLQTDHHHLAWTQRVKISTERRTRPKRKKKMQMSCRCYADAMSLSFILHSHFILKLSLKSLDKGKKNINDQIGGCHADNLALSHIFLAGYMI